MSKNIVIFLLACFISSASSAFAQDASRYSMNFIGNSYSVFSSKVEDDLTEHVLYVLAYNSEEVFDYQGFRLYETDIDPFISEIEQVRNKYSEWKEIAEQNNVKNYSKLIDIDFEPIIAISAIGDNLYAAASKLVPSFVVRENGDCLAFITTSKIKLNNLQGGDNLDCNGISFVFESADEINEFLTAIKTQRNIVNKKDALDKLFK